MLEESNSTLSDFPYMPTPTEPPAGGMHTLLREQLAYDRVELQAEVDANLSLLTPE